MRVALLCCAIFAWPMTSISSGSPADAKVLGTVTVLGDVVTAVPGAVVTFLRTDGQMVKVTTNQAGEYEVLLDPEYGYTMVVAGKQLCAMHRPPFRPRRGSVLKFDFTTTICGIIDGVYSGHSESKPNDDRWLYRTYYKSSYDSNAPYWFFEESVALGKDADPWLVVAFGEREQAQLGVRYGPFVSLTDTIWFHPNVCR